MRIIDAKWEKRNLGVSCAEIEIGKNDSSEVINEALKERCEQYQVAKVSSGNTEALSLLQANGFRFIEVLYETEIIFHERPVPPSVCKSLIHDVSYHIANKEEEKSILEVIRNGEIFSTDRIAVDSAFSIELAGRRYAYWMEELLNNPESKMIITEYQGNNVGFNVLKSNNNMCNGILGGLLPEYKDGGIGFANVYASLNAAYDLKSKKVISHVSSNNFQMFKLHLLFGMSVRRMTYNLVKHC